YFVVRIDHLARQHANGHAVSGNVVSGDLRAETVLSIGQLFLTYDSTQTDSVLWLARPADSLRTWLFPPAPRPFEFVSLIRWKEGGRVVWFNTDIAGADLLIELSSPASHRLTVVRVTCESGGCRTTSQDRGVPGPVSVSVSDDGSAVLINDSTIMHY